MAKPKKFSIRFALHTCGLASLFGMTLGITACSTLSKPPEEPQVVSYQYRPPYGYVRIEKIEANAPDNDHPYAISPDALQKMLFGMKTSGVFGYESSSTVFVTDELTEVVPHLTAALTKAGPKEDVTFAVTGSRGLFGNFSPKTVTTGRLFVREGKINLILGTVQAAVSQDMPSTQSSVIFVPGSRKNPVGRSAASVFPGPGAKLFSNRTDWVVFNAPAPTIGGPTFSSSGSPAPVFTPALDNRYKEIEEKLRILDRLKETKTITDAEYRERRRAILQGI